MITNIVWPVQFMIMIDSHDQDNAPWNVWRDKWDFQNLIFELEEDW